MDLALASGLYPSELLQYAVLWSISLMVASASAANAAFAAAT
jgi:hypothetical protein